MTDYVSAFGNPAAIYHGEATRTAERLRTGTTIIDGVIRWNSNGTVPPTECVALAAHIGLAVDVAACTRARDDETATFLSAYRKRNRKPSAEARMEMRAAFGRGAKVVNVVTGRTTRT